jgi:hypothetical protein
MSEHDSGAAAPVISQTASGCAWLQLSIHQITHLVNEEGFALAKYVADTYHVN